MEQIRDIVRRAAGASTHSERVEAYGHLVERFRDMACGYAYSILGDFHLAEDAAQEAFIIAFGKLDRLRQPAAFPGWFRRIVWSVCGQATRRPKLPTTSLEGAKELLSDVPEPAKLAEAQEMRDEVLKAIGELPAQQREVTTLFYINGYSQRDISEFLEVPVTTVKNRLNASRSRLKERMLNMVEQTLHNNAPNERFDKKVVEELLSRPRPLEVSGHPLREVWEDLRSFFPDCEVVDFDEIVSRTGSHLSEELQHRVGYGVDEASILRSGLTDQLVHHWLESGGGACCLITAGRTFRKGDLQEPQRSGNLFHQAEVLWVATGLDDDTPIELARKLASRVLRQESVDFGDPVNVGGGVIAREFSAIWKGKPLEFAVSGYHNQEVIRQAGLDPQEYRALCLCFGLERCALIRYDLDDLRKLWEPPYLSD